MSNNDNTHKQRNNEGETPVNTYTPTHPRRIERLSVRPSSWDRTFSPTHERYRNGLASALALVVGNSEDMEANSTSLQTCGLAPATSASFISHLFDKDTFDKLFAAEHMGNYVIVRKTGEKQWETMPLYARIGMHLLFYGPAAVRFLTWNWIRKILKEQSIRQGKIYDSTEPKLVLSQIQSFISTYSIDTSELLERNLNKYPTFNSFFSRKLKPNARPAASPKDLAVISAAADSRLTVFSSVDAAKKFWIKGRHFTVSSLLQDSDLISSLGAQPSLAIWRLAPQDYHRFHSPISGTVRKITHTPGDYYTVNPQAINEDLDVFTANTRSVAVIDAKLSNDTTKTVPVAFVAVGALLVGSIWWDKAAGQDTRRGEELGYFQYGGSTVIAIFPESAHIKWDDDLSMESKQAMEVLVRAGEKIGSAVLGGE